MSLREFVRLLRRYAVLVVLVTGLSTAGAAFASYAAAPTYESTTQLFVSTPHASTSIASEFSSGVLTGQRIATYTQLVDSPAVTRAVAGALGNRALAGAVAGEISATNPTGTLLINVTVKDHSPVRAQRIAAAVAANLQRAIRHIEAGTPTGHAPVTVTVVRSAGYDPAPVAPNHRLDVALGAILGLVVGVGAALLLNALSTTVLNASDLAGQLGVAVLAVIRDGRGKRRERLGGSNGVRPDIESYVHLRTSLQFLEATVRPRVLVVTGPTGGEGTTRIVGNLGRAFARAGVRTLVIDANLRGPALAAELHARPTLGLIDVLAHGDGLSAAVVDVESNLALLGTGPTVASPSEILGSLSMGRLLEDAAATYDVVLIDSPPVLAAADARVLAAMAQGTVVVVREGRTKRDHVIEGVNLLRQVGAHLTGLAVTSTRPSLSARAPDRLPPAVHEPPYERRAPQPPTAARRDPTPAWDAPTGPIPVPARRGASPGVPSTRVRRPGAFPDDSDGSLR